MSVSLSTTMTFRRTGALAIMTLCMSIPLLIGPFRPWVPNLNSRVGLVLCHLLFKPRQHIIAQLTPTIEKPFRRLQTMFGQGSHFSVPPNPLHRFPTPPPSPTPMILPIPGCLDCTGHTICGLQGVAVSALLVGWFRRGPLRPGFTPCAANLWPQDRKGDCATRKEAVVNLVVGETGQMA